MPCTIHEITMGALLHDVGKLLQRAFGTTAQLNWQTFDMESTLCPKGKFQNYTHRHVLFTNAFFDLMQQSNLRPPQGIDLEKVAHIASFHHKPESSPDPAAAWICAIADRYSAGMDRKASEDEKPDSGTKTAYRHMPLRCIFDEIVLDSKGPQPAKHGYQLAVLDPYDQKALLPVAWKHQEPELPKQYMQLWTDCWSAFQKILTIPNLTSRLLEEALLGFLELYTWAIPSSTMDLPDISLYDHLRTTAAIAACLYRYHEVAGEKENVTAIRNDSQLKFRFLAGDLSGLQNTLFTLKSQGVKGVSKILRARSFMLGAIAESATLQVMEAFGLPNCCVVQQAGGRFLILVPAVSEADDILQHLRNRFDAWLLEKYSGSLALNLALSSPFSGKDFTQGTFSDVFAQINTEVEASKQSPLSTCKQGVIKQEFLYNRACDACGVRPAQIVKGNLNRCRTCEQEVEIGSHLTRAELMVWDNNADTLNGATDVLSLRLTLGKEGSLPQRKHNLLSVRNIQPENKNSPWALRLLANYIPKFSDEYATNHLRYAEVVDEPMESSSGLTKTFAHIAAEALEKQEQGTFIGKPFLGLLKADVDHLGAIFSIGLKRQERQQDRFTLSRMAQLSRMVDLYFSGYLQGLIKRDYPDTYTIYAGGDDLLLIGPWRQMLHLAGAIAESFAEYTGNHPQITISAGFSLMGANHPVNRTVDEAEKLLKLAKGSDLNKKNRICTFGDGRPMGWAHYKKCLENAQWIHEQMQGKNGVSTGFIYRILKITNDVEAAESGNVRKAGWLAKFAYHLARNLKGSNKMERERKRAIWLERLGFDQLLKFTGQGPELQRWRLPLSIALYRNRK